MADSYYETKINRSLNEREIQNVLDMIKSLKELPSPVVDAAIKLSNNIGHTYVEVWWDSESECWLADFTIDPS